MADIQAGRSSSGQEHLFPNYARAPLSFERGEGVWLLDKDGNRYLDFMSGIAVNSLGHAHPHLVQSLKNQAEKLWHTSNIFQIAEGERLANRLCEATFADKVFFANSGAEALEACIKTARRYYYDKGDPERYHILTFEGAFHGRTLATIAAGGQAKYLEGFGPKADGFDQLGFGDHDALKAAIAKPEVAAVLIEPVQGEGGVRSVPHVCLRGLRELCDQYGVLLIMDEVQTGVGRSGKFFAHEWSGITPDLMAIAKGIGGGFPLGACLATEDVASCMKPGTHGTTFGGNPLAMAVANAVLDIVLADGFLDHVNAMALRLKQSLGSILDQFPDLFEDVRGEGLLMGLKCRLPVGDVVSAMRDEKLLTVAAGENVMRLLPPLIITEDHVNTAIEKIDNACIRLRGSESMRARG
jgi:acetylornithine/N-succinyldiaminopimelate aminotransferase